MSTIFTSINLGATIITLLFVSLQISTKAQRAIIEMDGKDYVEHYASETDSKTLSYEVKEIPLEVATPFLSLSVVWYMDQPFTDNQKNWISLGAKNSEWSSFHPLSIDPHADGQAGRYVSNLVLTKTEATQFRLYLQIPADQMPNISGMEVHFFNPQASADTPIVKPTLQHRACICPQPAFLGRADWCPNGECPEDATPVNTTVSHMIVHHTASSNNVSDWAAVVRSVWDFHVNVNGWDDIGYNWLIDPNGNLYEGRGDNRMGAHFCSTNGGTMGIAMLGNFAIDNVTASPAAKTTLEQLLAWKSCDVNVAPVGEGFHAASGQNLMHISGHRDGCATTCPGDNFYPELAQVRQNVLSVQENDCTEILSAPELDGEIINFDLVRLTWTDNSDAEDGFVVERALSTNSFTLLTNLPANTVTFEDTTTEPDNVYRYRVKATSNDLGDSDYSNEISVLTEASTIKNPFLNQQTVQIFPNPNDGDFTVQVNNEINGQLIIQVVDATAKPLTPPLFFQKAVTQFANSFYFKDLPKGQHYLKIRQGSHLAWFSLNISQ